jgi:ribonuclease E
LKTILFNAREQSSSGGEVRVAIVEGTEGAARLVDLDIETEDREKNKGNIYRGSVMNIEPSLQAAFVNYGGQRHGFLPAGEVAPEAYHGEAAKNPRQITDMLKRRQAITVQVVKDEIGNKGAALTTYISLPGRYLVLMPGSDMKGISRKIEDEEERQRIRELTQSLEPPPGFGLIVRTAGLNQPKQALAQDLKYLLRLWAQIEKKIESAAVPALIHREQDITLRTLRDYLTPDVTRIVFDTPESLKDGREFVKQVAPKLVRSLELHEGEQSIFSAFGIEAQVESLYERRVALASGGSIIIEPTEALVSVDVNSGKMTKPRDHEETAYQTNLEAAAEVARQLRLRDLGGIIVIDFIDMENAAHKTEVEKRVREAIKNDKARIKIGHISPNGTLELTRQRIRSTLHGGVTIPCPHCGGSGTRRSPNSENASALRALGDKLAAEPLLSGARLVMETHAELALRLLNERRRELAELEARYHVPIEIVVKEAKPH